MTHEQKPIMPGTADWLRTVTFGDMIKIVAFVGSGIAMFTALQSDLNHEIEMRRLLEQHTMEIIEQMRETQKENSARFDQRFIETSQQNHDLMTEVKTRIDRLEAKIDALGTYRYQQPQGGH